MVLHAGAVLVRPGYVRLKLNNAMPYLNLLEIITLENIYKFKVALFTHKITNNATNVPTIFKGTFTLASEVHSYITSFVSNLNFHRPRINNNYGAITFAFAGPKMWEKILSK